MNTNDLWLYGAISVVLLIVIVTGRSSAGGLSPAWHIVNTSAGVLVLGALALQILATPAVWHSWLLAGAIVLVFVGRIGAIRSTRRVPPQE
jgi:hypothetical protein